VFTYPPRPVTQAALRSIGAVASRGYSSAEGQDLLRVAGPNGFAVCAAAQRGRLARILPWLSRYLPAGTVPGGRSTAMATSLEQLLDRLGSGIEAALVGAGNPAGLLIRVTRPPP